MGTLESSGMMREMSERLGHDEELAAGYRRAHEPYLARRAELGDVPEIAGDSAGGMPDRVKCLHMLLGQSLAQGPGSTRSATRRWTASAPGGDQVPALRASDRP